MQDFSILANFKFERQPVGVRFALNEPEGIQRTDKYLGVCEMFKEAQTGEPFYASVDNIQCGTQVMGMTAFPPVMASGQLGKEFAMFKNESANRRVYDYVPVIPRDIVRYIIHAPLEKLTFDPDVLIFTADAQQAEILLRASTYSTGEMWNAKGSSCLACAWLYAYPYLSGQINYGVSGLGFSMKAREVLPAGLVIISVPGERLPMLMANLEEMEWEPHWFNLGRDGFCQAVKDMEGRIADEYPPELVW